MFALVLAFEARTRHHDDDDNINNNNNGIYLASSHLENQAEISQGKR